MSYNLINNLELAWLRSWCPYSHALQTQNAFCMLCSGEIGVKVGYVVFACANKSLAIALTVAGD